MKRPQLMTVEQVRRMLRRAIAQMPTGSLRAFARLHRIYPSAVSDALHSRPPGPTVLAALGLEKIIRVGYKRKEPNE
jgi:hypothetical protein